MESIEMNSKKMPVIPSTSTEWVLTSYTNIQLTIITHCIYCLLPTRSGNPRKLRISIVRP